jgi:TRAP-type C4-dicarboxylate transport system substrate-binding protein
MRTAILTACAALAASVFAAPASAKTELLFNLFTPPRHIINTGVLGPWIKAVEKATEGRVTFKVPPQSVAPPPRQMDSVRRQVVDMAFQYNGLIRKQAPLIQVSFLPMISRTGEASALALWRTHNKFFAPKQEFKGVHLLGFFGGHGGDMCSLKEPIDSVAALRKLKMWTLPGYPAQALTRLNVVVVPGPAVRIYPIVSKGIVDGVSGLSVKEVIRFNAIQFVKSCTVLTEKIQSPTFSVLINSKKWASIPERDRKIITEMAGEALARRSRAWDTADKAGPAEAEKMGKTIIRPSAAFAAALRKAWTPLHAGWIKEASGRGIDGKAAFDFYVEQAKKVDAELQ